MRILAVAAIAPLAAWGFVIGLLPAIGCGLSDSQPTGGIGVWYCGDGHELAAWLYIGACTLLPAAVAVWIRSEALRERSWPTLFGGLAVAAVSPVLLMYLIAAVS